MSDQLHATAALLQEKEPRYPLDRRLTGPQGPSGRCEKENIPDPTWTRIPTPAFHPVASRYTDCVLPAQVVPVQTITVYYQHA
jgi:hypothetical protein